MRTLFLLLVFFYGFGICGCAEKKSGVTIEGKAPGGVLEICLVENAGMSRTVAEAVVDSAGKYRLEYPVKHPGIFTLADSKYETSAAVYVAPGDRIQADFSSGKMEFSGDEKANNQFLERFRDYQQKLAKQNPGNLQVSAAEKAATLKKAAAALDFIDRAGLKDVVFAGTLKTTVLKDKYNSMLNYPTFYKMIFGTDATIDSNYYNFVREIDLSSPYWGNVAGVYAFLQDMFRVMETYGYLNSGMEDYLVKRGMKIENRRLREEYFLYALGFEFYGFNQHFNALVGSIEDQITTEQGKQHLAELKNKYQAEWPVYESFLAGKPAFNFIGMDADGKQHSLAELRGKVVVVDVWNTGCKPCIAEIPFLKTIEQQFAGKEVVFISYSLDTDMNLWKNFMAAKGMGGNQWIDTLGFKSDLVQAFALKGIPRFMVFGRQGEIVDVFAPRPSDPRLTLLLDQELKK